MPNKPCDEFAAGSDNLVQFQLFDETVDPATEIIDASVVNLTMFDSDDVELSGVSWPLDMTPYNGTTGQYEITVPAAAVVTKGDRIRLEIATTATEGESLFHQRNIPVVEQTPE